MYLLMQISLESSLFVASFYFYKYIKFAVDCTRFVFIYKVNQNEMKFNSKQRNKFEFLYLTHRAHSKLACYR